MPLIIYDPRASADPGRGSVSEHLVEGIDLAPTFSEFFGARPPMAFEGRSLTPILEGREPETWRDVAISEYDYATREARTLLGVGHEDARLIMAFDGRWKYVHAEGFRPMLFDLETDPDELTDLGEDPAFKAERACLHEAIFAWARRHHNRLTKSAEWIEQVTGKEPPGVIICVWDEEEYAEVFGKDWKDQP